MGPFTQRDPIGLAGGVNQYGYVGGDPVNSTDPLGLEVVPKDEEAARIWRRLQAQALKMRMSKDSDQRASGMALLGMISDLKQMQDTVKIHVDLFRGTQTGFLQERFGGGNGINLDSNDFSDRPATVVLAHELGHAHHIWAQGKGLTIWDAMNPFSENSRAGIRAENHARNFFFSCGERWSHLTKGPSCQ